MDKEVPAAGLIDKLDLSDQLEPVGPTNRLPVGVAAGQPPDAIGVLREGLGYQSFPGTNDKQAGCP